MQRLQCSEGMFSLDPSQVKFLAQLMGKHLFEDVPENSTDGGATNQTKTTDLWWESKNHVLTTNGSIIKNNALLTRKGVVQVSFLEYYKLYN